MTLPINKRASKANSVFIYLFINVACFYVLFIYFCNNFIFNKGK